MEYITLSTLFKKSSLISFAKIFIPGFIFLAIMGMISVLGNIHFSMLSEDPIQLLNGEPYVGIITRVGIIIWAATFAILLYSSKISSIQKKPKQQTSLLIWAGLLTLFLLLDDSFMLHDVIFPEYLNINEKVFFSFYSLSVIALFYFYYKEILNSDYVLLILAFVLLGASALTDMALRFGITIPYSYAIEDGSKFLGIIAWFSYFTRTSYNYIKPVM